MGVVALLHRFFRKNAIFEAPKDKPPVWWIRSLLIFAQTAVSFAHGANDGQKGIGIMMAILVVYMPYAFNLNHIPWWVIAIVACVLGIGTMV
jgi:phosphate/sulfate permease